jgi:intergrase/recombinase
MWTEIKITDLESRDREAIAALQKFVVSQAEMNKYYKDKYTLEDLKQMLNRKKDLEIRFFIYEDEEITATLALKKNDKGELRLLTTSCARGDLSKASDIVQEAIKKAMLRLNTNYCYALWSADNFEKGNSYFWTFVDRCKQNFTSSSNEEYQTSKYILKMSM